MFNQKGIAFQIRAQNFSQKVASKNNFRATTILTKADSIYMIQEFCKIQEERQLMYIDEIGIGKDLIAPRVWCNKRQIFNIYLSEILTRINIIGAMNREFKELNQLKILDKAYSNLQQKIWAKKLCISNRQCFRSQRKFFYQRCFKFEQCVFITMFTTVESN
ncbi:unnamed protein product [Paramecium primaurelia]|uniref:Uncharacterized protein n=1 Tax=Paramecium primaurelia TaxID=5886 RepID=A0A8S1LTM2_PARPR|nr:unnamed protein product [Paramecium primaurelia]CAD8070837.1 unnamed protein product [Paramecium primaurelia]